jgi:limonene-1,2-epoxide hydrolase
MRAPGIRAAAAAMLTGAALLISAGTRADARDESDDRVRVVQAMVEAWNTMDLERVIALFAPDGVFHSVMLEPVEGRDALRAHFTPVFAELDRVTLEVVNLGAVGDVVFVERVDDFVYRGKHSRIPVVGVIEVADGHIREWRDYYDRTTMVEAMTVP